MVQRKKNVSVLITAAGMGKRFGVLTKAKNKCLFPIQGKPIINHILDTCHDQGLRDVYVVAGYQSNQLEAAIGKRANILFNPFFAVSGILGSFWQAKDKLQGKSFIFTTSDHFFHPNVLSECLRKKSAVHIVVQKKNKYTKEDAKVIIRNSKVVEMGKDLPVKDADGEYAGMAFMGSKFSDEFFKCLEEYMKFNGPNGYMMEIMKQTSKKLKVPIKYTVCEEGSRTEIDSVPDLIHARKIAKFNQIGG